MTKQSKVSFFLCLFFISLATFTSRCTKDKHPVLVNSAPSSDCDSTKVLYCNKIKPIMDTYCASNNCHVNGGTGTGDFSVYSGVKSKVDNGSLQRRVISLKDMPPRGSTALLPADTSLISQWLSEGAKEK